MLVVEPNRRYNLKQISQHRWMSCRSASITDDLIDTMQTDCCDQQQQSPQQQQPTTTPANLDSIVVNHMLQLPNLTFDEIAESVHRNTFNHIYAIYNLLVDKLHAKRKEQHRIQQLATLAYSK